MMSIKKKNRGPEVLEQFEKEMKNKGQLNKKAYDKFREERYDDFKSLQKSLWKEQYGLCCYCMRKICFDMNEEEGLNNVKHSKPKSGKPTEGTRPMTVEHFKPKDKYECLSLSYCNLLACCDGKLDDNESCCGRKKGNKELHAIPNPSCEENFNDFARKIKFKTNGKIDVDDSLEPEEKKALLSEIIDVLNLNADFLAKRREQALLRIIELYENNGNQDKKSFFNRLCTDKRNRNKGRIEYHAFIEYLFLKEATNSKKTNQR